MKNTSSYVLSLSQIDKTNFARVGGKGANLGELTGIKEIQVPDGFCISTEAFKRIIAEIPSIHELLDRLSNLKSEDRDEISRLSLEIRTAIENIVVPLDIADEVKGQVKRSGENGAFAVRSSATAEDLPTASFAGQQDSYLNVTGAEAILKHVSKCWASLFTERAVIYRIQNKFDHSKVHLAVVVQKMIFPDVSGIMFTADPVSANRKVLSIDAGFGLGEALVSGLVNADNYKVHDGKITGKKISRKVLSVIALKDGGTKQQSVEAEMQSRQALTDDQILSLEQIGRKIEAHFRYPQDIEWCLADGVFYIVQSRPITTLYPLPETNDSENHVYISTGHQQMMTDAIKPLGLSLWQLTSGRKMYVAGGRMFVDIAKELASPAKRAVFVDVLGKSDPLIRAALIAILERKGFINPTSDEEEMAAGTDRKPLPDYRALNEYDPAIVTELIGQSRAEIATLKQVIQTKTGVDLVDFIVADIQRMRQQSAQTQSFEVIMTSMNAALWINEKVYEWLGEKNVADTLSQSVPNNITSEMGLELLDVADAIRPYPEVIQYLHTLKDDDFLDGLTQHEGGKEVRKVICNFLEKYGMRCAGEIDITKTRWSEKPAMLVPVILSNINNLAPGESKRKFEHGKQEALKKEQDILSRLAVLPDGKEKARETKRMIRLLRDLAGYREYPKYAIVSHYFICKQALLKEAEQLVSSGIIQDKEDIFYLNFEELRELYRGTRPDYQEIDKRKADYLLFEKLSPPRVMTSDGEIFSGTYKHDNLPPHAIAGLAVSSGVVEGRARVILNMEDADLEEGDILITTFTDPSWTPLFVSIKGLVTEVGGLMTHGAVIAREYGLPAVVGMEQATRLIKDGQHIRVNGTDGYVEIL